MKKLFCLPYAGGSSTMYSRLKMYLDNVYEVIPVEYPGHGYRMNEKLLTDFDELVDDIVRFINEKAGEEEFFLLGYSLGGMLSYSTAKKIKSYQKIADKLKAVIICACSAPSISEPLLCSNDMNDEMLIQYLIKLGGTQIMSKEDERALRFFLPIVRADFSVYDNGKSKNVGNEVIPLDIPIAIFHSKEEAYKLEEWNKYSSTAVFYKGFSGGHFFINQQCEIIAKEAKDFLKRYFE